MKGQMVQSGCLGSVGISVVFFGLRWQHRHTGGSLQFIAWCFGHASASLSPKLEIESLQFTLETNE